MKTLQHFQEDATFGIENLMAEAEGFKDAVKRRRKKKEFLSRSEKKIQKLKNNPGHWDGLQ